MLFLNFPNSLTDLIIPIIRGKNYNLKDSFQHWSFTILIVLSQDEENKAQKDQETCSRSQLMHSQTTGITSVLFIVASPWSITMADRESVLDKDLSVEWLNTWMKGWGNPRKRAQDPWLIKMIMWKCCVHNCYRFPSILKMKQNPSPIDFHLDPPLLQCRSERSRKPADQREFGATTPAGILQSVHAGGNTLSRWTDEVWIQSISSEETEELLQPVQKSRCRVRHIAADAMAHADPACWEEQVWDKAESIPPLFPRIPTHQMLA